MNLAIASAIGMGVIWVVREVTPWWRPVATERFVLAAIMAGLLILGTLI